MASSQKRSQPGQQRISQGFDAAVQVIGGFILEHVPELFAGVEFRAAGRQRHDAHARWQALIAVAQMEPSEATRPGRG